MTFKIVAYGVRENEKPYFVKLNKYNYELKLLPELLNHENIETAKGMDAVLLRANCIADAENLNLMKKWGIKYVFTRTVGYNHIDLAAAKANQQLVARVPSYSPHAVADLAFTLGLTLARHVSLASFNSYQKDFQVKPEEFSREIRDLTIGIVGTGRIGVVEANNYKTLGAKVLGYDVYQSDAAKEVVQFVEQGELFSQADIVSLHVPYFPGKNDRFINAELIAKMKPDAILVNTARAEIVDVDAVVSALKNQKIGGFATDVIDHEQDYLGQKVDEIKDPTLRELTALYPRVIITPHIGSYTVEALKDMISISYDNFNEVLQSGTSQNLVIE
ncbi:NAD(P)-dependent oxidoreductase [Xylocopilactobacillus apicola]|uniref:Lactate dehydrogenase n=1 Tax=Xylocopilactobacillus apicola TaxID=2932184 RepID=A0AAU9CVF6_9LACO|nr:NAD(P)-dependent oxidoreductase [Xylocopilactobacillus apicola]BDR57967.1 lactate dehydrogenase [Xylocopilactobacillus apicola]